MSTKRNLACALIAAFGTCTFASATATDFHGYNDKHGHVVLDLPAGSGVLLQSFDFEFTGTDHHFREMRVLQHPKQMPPTIDIGYSDKNGDDKFTSDITLAPFAGTAMPDQKEAESCKKSCTIVLEKPQMGDPVFVLLGFDIQYPIRSDHHIEEIGISEQDGTATVTLNDKNDDDVYKVTLQYAYIPRLRVSAIEERSGQVDRGGTESVDIPGGTAVLRGFHLHFRNGDHHIKKLGIVLDGNGHLATYFSDKNHDDPYDWNAQFAILRDSPSALTPMPTPERPAVELTHP